MGRLTLILLLLALMSGGIGLICRSTTASGLAAFLFAGFIGLSVIILVLRLRQARSI